MIAGNFVVYIFSRKLYTVGIMFRQLCICKSTQWQRLTAKKKRKDTQSMQQVINRKKLMLQQLSHIEQYSWHGVGVDQMEITIKAATSLF